MRNYQVRVNAKSVDDLKYVDFSTINHGSIKLKASRSFTNVHGKLYFNYPGLSFETYINGSQSVGLVLLSKNMIDKSNKSLELPSRPVISGTMDRYCAKFNVLTDKSVDTFNIDEGEDLLIIQFCSKGYYDLLMKDEAEGVRSANVDVKVYVDGKFKPYSEYQMVTSGYMLVSDSHKDGCKFYERDYISGVTDDNGMILNNLSSQWINCSL